MIATDLTLYSNPLNNALNLGIINTQKAAQQKQLDKAAQKASSRSNRSALTPEPEREDGSSDTSKVRTEEAFVLPSLKPFPIVHVFVKKFVV